MPKVTAEEVEPHWIPGGCNQRPVPSAPLLPFKGSAVWIWFGAFAMAGAELTGVEMGRLSWFGDTRCPHRLPAPSPLQPFPHLKGKDKSKQREVKQSFMERMKQVKNRQAFQQTNRKLLCPFEKSSKAIRQGLGIKKDQRGGAPPGSQEITSARRQGLGVTGMRALKPPLPWGPCRLFLTCQQAGGTCCSQGPTQQL